MKAGLTVKLGMAIAPGVLLAGAAFAQEPGGGPGMGFADRRPPMERSFGAQGGNHAPLVETMMPRWWSRGADR